MFRKIPKSVRWAIPVVVAALLFAGWMRRSDAHTQKTGWAADWIAIALDLTPDQQAGLNDLEQELLTGKQAFEDMHKEFHAAFVLQTRADSIDRESLNRLFEAKEEQWQKTRVALIDKFAAWHSLLTPEQRNKMIKILEKHDMSHRRRHK